MSDFEIATDIEMVMELMGLNASELAEQIGVKPITVSRWKESGTPVSASGLSSFYDFVFAKGIRLNRIKAQLFKEECSENAKVLFHGAKTYIEGPISISRSKKSNDFGQGFYCGESMEQSAMFVAGYPESSLYILKFEDAGLSSVKLSVDTDWMLFIAWHRGKLSAFGEHPLIHSLLSRLEGADYIIAPIADNRMFEIIDSFIDGEITDVQCRHCLSATDLGNQYVFITEKAVGNLAILRHCYLARAEKEYYIRSRRADTKVGNDKVRIARKQYRGQGRYIEEILA